MEIMKDGGWESKAAVCFIPFLGWIPALGFLVFEKEANLRRYAVMTLLVHGLVVGVYAVAVPLMKATGVLRPVAGVVSGVAGVGFLVGMLWAMLGVYEGRRVEFPVVSEWVDKLVK